MQVEGQVALHQPGPVGELIPQVAVGVFGLAHHPHHVVLVVAGLDGRVAVGRGVGGGGAGAVHRADGHILVHPADREGELGAAAALAHRIVGVGVGTHLFHRLGIDPCAVGQLIPGMSVGVLGAGHHTDPAALAVRLYRSRRAVGRFAGGGVVLGHLHGLAQGGDGQGEGGPAGTLAQIVVAVGVGCRHRKGAVRAVGGLALPRGFDVVPVVVGGARLEARDGVPQGDGPAGIAQAGILAHTAVNGGILGRADAHAALGDLGAGGDAHAPRQIHRQLGSIDLGRFVGQGHRLDGQSGLAAHLVQVDVGKVDLLVAGVVADGIGAGTPAGPGVEQHGRALGQGRLPPHIGKVGGAAQHHIIALLQVLHDLGALVRPLLPGDLDIAAIGDLIAPALGVLGDGIPQLDLIHVGADGAVGDGPVVEHVGIKAVGQRAARLLEHLGVGHHPAAPAPHTRVAGGPLAPVRPVAGILVLGGAGILLHLAHRGRPQGQQGQDQGSRHQQGHQSLLHSITPQTWPDSTAGPPPSGGWPPSGQSSSRW